MGKYYSYIIESQKDLRWYVGHTNNVERRLSEHNAEQNKSTRGKGPWKLVLLREFDSNLEASRFEVKLKRLRNKEYIRNIYKEYFLGI